MNFRQIFLILRARLGIILMVLGITVITTLAVSLLLPKAYKASTSLVLNYKGVDPVSGATLPGQLMPGYLSTQVDIINSMSAALRVVDELRLADDAVVRANFMKATEGRGTIREWEAGRLLKYLDVAPSRESSVLSVQFSDSNARRAAEVANGFANAYQHISVELKMDPSKKAAVYYNQQIKRLREAFEAAQTRLTAYQQENNIVSADGRNDLETARLNEISSQLTAIQGLRMEAASRRNQARGAGRHESPDVIANPLIQNLKLQLAQSEMRRSMVAERFTQDHPTWQMANAEVEKLQSELNRHVSDTNASIANTERILQQRESELRDALDAQKTRVLELNRKRDVIKVMSNEVDSAQKAYETAAQRFMQTSLEAQSNASEVSVLNLASPPLLPASPKIILNTLLSVLLGAILGVVFAFLSELLDRRIRCVEDLLLGLQAPVLGVMTLRQPRRMRLGMPTLRLPYRPLP
jgi:succinoglycan biosynthesis transport protein ExoP